MKIVLSQFFVVTSCNLILEFPFTIHGMAVITLNLILCYMLAHPPFSLSLSFAFLVLLTSLTETRWALLLISLICARFCAPEHAACAALVGFVCSTYNAAQVAYLLLLFRGLVLMKRELVAKVESNGLLSYLPREWRSGLIHKTPRECVIGMRDALGGWLKDVARNADGEEESARWMRLASVWIDTPMLRLVPRRIRVVLEPDELQWPPPVLVVRPAANQRPSWFDEERAIRQWFVRSWTAVILEHFVEPLRKVVTVGDAAVAVAAAAGAQANEQFIYDGELALVVKECHVQNRYALKKLILMSGIFGIVAVGMQFRNGGRMAHD